MDKKSILNNREFFKHIERPNNTGPMISIRDQALSPERINDFIRRNPMRIQSTF